MAAVSPAERVMVTDRVNAPLRRLRSSRSARGLVLVPGAALAFGWANSPWAQAYFGMQNLHTALVVSAFHLELSLARFVNDALMAIFFSSSGWRSSASSSPASSPACAVPRCPSPGPWAAWWRRL